MRRDLTFKTASIAGSSDLTILAPIKKGLAPALDAITYKTRVKRVLRLLHLGRTNSHEYEIGRVLSDAVERVGKIHSIRIAVLEPEDKVLLVVTFDGAWESYIRVIWQKVSRLLDLIFCNTEGYKLGWESTYDEWCAWLRSAQAETLFLYSQPNLTNTDTHYLKSIEQIHRRESDPSDANLAAVSYRVPTAEANAESIWSTGQDLSSWKPNLPPISKLPGEPAFKQGLRSLVGLYRLSDVYLAKIGDGNILHRAAQELLIEFKEMLLDDKGEFEKDFSDAMDEARKYYNDAFNWFFQDQDYQREIPELPKTQDDLIDAVAKDVQGGILHPYTDVTDGCMLLLAFESKAGLAKFLESFSPTNIARQNSLSAGAIAQNIALTVEGLRLAGLSDAEIQEMPEEYAQGMDKRQAVLGDLYTNHPRRWNLPKLNWHLGVDATEEKNQSVKHTVQLSSVHAVIQLRLRKDASITSPKQKLLKHLNTILDIDQSNVPKNGAIPLSLQWMHRLRDESDQTIEHFGFREAESNPIYNESNAERFNNQVHIGEILHGYPNAGDGHIPANGAKSERAKALLKNGSFLVIRKLSQDVGQLHEIVEKNSSGLPPEMVLAKMMGRWPAGAKDSTSASIEGTPVGNESEKTNDFNFEADVAGASCPFHAHIRRANPRSNPATQDIGKRPPRIIRRGMSYGERYIASKDQDENKKSLEQDRGLMFMAYNASIGEQFEVIQRWISGGNSTGSYSGQSDPFLGVAEPGRPRFYQFAHGEQVHRIQLDGTDDFHGDIHPLVRLEWGVYLFAPSLTALYTLAQIASKPPELVTVEWSVQEGEKRIQTLQAIEKQHGFEEAKEAWKMALEDPDSALKFEAASIWAAIRSSYGGVLKTPYGVLVATQKLADQVLLDTAKNLTAQEYLPRMRDSFGELYLGMDSGRVDLAYEKESQSINEAVRKLGQDFNAILDQVEKVVHARIDEYVNDAKENADDRGETQWQATIDVRDIIETVIAHFCETWFGLVNDGVLFEKGGVNWLAPLDNGIPRYPGHFMAPSRYVFQPNPSDTVRSVASAHGKSLSRAMTAYLEIKKDSLKETHPLVKTILENGENLNDRTYASRTLLGLMMGFVPTTDGLTRRIAVEWIREGTLWSLRSQFAGQASKDWSHPAFIERFKKAFNHAFLLRAAPELLWRTAIKDHQIGDGSHAVEVKTNEKVIVGQISLTQQGLESQNQDSYQQSYAYAFGDSRKNGKGAKPTHACPGNTPAMAVMWGVLKALVTYPESMRVGTSAVTFVVQNDSVSNQEKSRKRSKKLDTESFYSDGATDSTANPTQLFAFGDSWVWQSDLIGNDKRFFDNLASALRKKGFAFVPSVFQYTAGDQTGNRKRDPQFNKNEAGFNYPGCKLSELMPKKQSLKDRFQLLKKDSIEVKTILMSAGGNDLASYKETKDIGINKVSVTRADYTTSKLFEILNDGATDLNSAFNVEKKEAFLNSLKENYEATFKILLEETQCAIVIHGYGYPVPDGRIVNIIGLKMGPWLKPVFDLKHIDVALGRLIMENLIDALNEIIIEVVNNTNKNPQFKNRLHYVEIRGLFEAQADFNLDNNGYKKYWANELHATQIGYDLLAQKILKKIKSPIIDNNQ